MKILLLTNVDINNVHHSKIRGTENIVKVIAHEMNKLGLEVEILANEEIYIGSRCKNDLDKTINYFSRGKLNDTSAFKSKLIEIKPDIVQFHGFNHTWGVSHLLACKELSIKTILWHNVPKII